MAVNPAVASMEAGNTVPDPGAVDNRLSLDPGDPRWSKTIKGWEDGTDYTLKLKLRQMSPGEFEVVGLDGAESESESDAADVEEDKAEEKMPMKPGKVNRAVMAMEEE